MQPAPDDRRNAGFTMKSMKGEAIPRVEKHDANPKNEGMEPEAPERSGTRWFAAAEFKNKALTPNEVSD